MKYNNFNIEPNECWGFLFSHFDYDGPEDSRIGSANTIEEAKEAIDEMIENLYSGDQKAYKPMEAWSGGIAENH